MPKTNKSHILWSVWFLRITVLQGAILDFQIQTSAHTELSQCNVCDSMLQVTKLTAIILMNYENIPANVCTICTKRFFLPFVYILSLLLPQICETSLLSWL